MSWGGKRIFVQDSVLNPAGQRGVNRCFLFYTRALAQAFPGRVWVYSSRTVEPAGLHRLLPLSAHFKIPSLRSRVSRFDNIYGSLAAGLSAGVFYSPFYGYIRTSIPQVFSAYDMIYEKFPHHFPPAAPGISEHIEEKRKCFERAALVLCISRNTANDILEIYPQISKEKLEVVYLGVDDLFFQDSRARIEGKPYFLYVGNRDRYKNFQRFLSAFGKSGLAGHFNLRLVSPVEVNFTSLELETIRQYSLTAHIEIETALSDEALHVRYQQAFAYVCPSEYEGFGLPVLEAMASGTLVVAAQVSSIPEVGGDVPLYFDPYSEESLISALQCAHQLGENEREARIQLGKDRAAMFTWKASQEAFVRAIAPLVQE